MLESAHMLQRLDDRTGARLPVTERDRGTYRDWMLAQIIGRDAVIFSLQEAKDAHEARLKNVECDLAYAWSLLTEHDAEFKALPRTFWQRVRWLVRGA